HPALGPCGGHIVPERSGRALLPHGWVALSDRRRAARLAWRIVAPPVGHGGAAAGQLIIERWLPPAQEAGREPIDQRAPSIQLLSALLGAAPTLVALTSPFLNRIIVGMPRTP